MSSIKEPSSGQDSNRINVGFFLNLSTEFAAQGIYIMILILFLYNRTWSLGPIACLALGIPLLIEIAQPYDDFFLNLGTEFLGIFVGKLIIEKQERA